MIVFFDCKVTDEFSDRLQARQQPQPLNEKQRRENPKPETSRTKTRKTPANLKSKGNSMNWADPDKWLQLKQGIGCPMCEDIHLPENQHSFLIAELEHVILRLPKNQILRGWTVIFAKRHVAELFEFSDEELCAFWRSVSQVGQILYSIYQPPKINYCVYGNLIPHVHCHLIPQSYSMEPQMLTVIDLETKELSEQEYRQMIDEIKMRIDNK